MPKSKKEKKQKEHNQEKRKYFIFAVILVLMLSGALFVVILKSKNTTFENGTVIYFDPVTNTICSEEESKSEIETKTGCMRWYVFNDTDSFSKVKLLLDHNTTAVEAWTSENIHVDGIEVKEAKKTLLKDTSTWHKNVKKTVRFLTLADIAQITGKIEIARKQEGVYVFDDSLDYDEGNKGKNKYAWLFDNTIECFSYGCNFEDDDTNGYWVAESQEKKSIKTWGVYREGEVTSVIFSSESALIGIRPVISIPRSLIENKIKADKKNSNSKNKNENTKEENVALPDNSEVVGFYNAGFKIYEYYDDFIELKTDGTFYRQINLTNGYKNFEGKYSITKKDNKNAVKLVIDEDSLGGYEIDTTYYFEIGEDSLIFMGKALIPTDNGGYKCNIFAGCFGTEPITWPKIEGTETKYKGEFQLDGAIHPNEY